LYRYYSGITKVSERGRHRRTQLVKEIYIGPNRDRC
jgi:hypothetical protein